MDHNKAFEFTEKLSIIIPAYNEEEGIESTIRELLDYEPLSGAEIIVVNDGSKDRTAEICKEKGYEFFMETPTNQQFIILENSKMVNLKDKVAFSFWEKYDDTHTVVRFATSWATTENDIKLLSEIL